MADKEWKPDYQTIGFLLKQVDDELTREANNSMRAIDMTLSQARILRLVDHAPGGRISLKELEQLSHTSQATCAGTVARLEQKGYLESESDPDDRRTKQTRLTKKGRDVMYAVNSYIKQTERRVFRPLSESEEHTLHVLLKKVREGMK